MAIHSSRPENLLRYPDGVLYSRKMPNEYNKAENEMAALQAYHVHCGFLKKKKACTISMSRATTAIDSDPTD